MKVERRVHKGWQEHQRAVGALPELAETMPETFGKWQYIYTAAKGKISLIQLPDYFNRGTVWEIYCLEGELFEDVERFASKAEAEVRIKEVMGEEIEVADTA